MRLIDADKVVEDNKEIIDCEIDHPIYQNTVREILDAQPTIEPKTGRWIEREHFYNDEETIDEWQSERCSVCDKYLTTPYRYFFYHHNYCPNCGARMENNDEAD